MAPRLELQQILVNILGSDNVYFQPPENIHMVYPCIVYHRDDIQINHANDLPYKQVVRYQVTVISQDPDNEFVKQVAELPMCDYDRFFTAENLNHDVFRLFF